MDGGDGWRVFTCPAGAQDKTIINKIMLRFRPIAPKPNLDGSSSSCWNSEKKNGDVTSVRKKRKYVRVKKINSSDCFRRRRKRKPLDLGKEAKENDQNEKLFTRQLLSEKIDLGLDLSSAKGSCSSFDGMVKEDKMQKKKIDLATPFFLMKQMEDGDLGGGGVSGPDRRAVRGEKRIIETWVTVESVTYTCMDSVGGLGGTDVEKMRNLERDACPGFISDGSSRVEWVNEAYRKMVTVGREDNGEKLGITVRLVIKEKVLPYLFNTVTTFTCWVRLQYTWQKENYSQLVPCDVWKMECGGGFAWKLDVKAALSLGL